MNSRRNVLKGLAATAALSRLGGRAVFANDASEDQKQGLKGSSGPTATLTAADIISFPGSVDCNSPAHWDGDTFYIFNSAGNPTRSFGTDLFHLGSAEKVIYLNEVNGARWLEATFKDPNGTLYGWYHNEPHPVCPSKPELTAPRIGALKSKDNGAHWEDLGLIIDAPPYPLRCHTENKYFTGGNGDFSVILDNDKEFFYFFFSTYYRDTSEQGVSVARLRFSDRDDPVGKVTKWYKGGWSEPGFGGHVTPALPVAVDWNKADANAFWGPSIHWNTYLQSYVVLLNHACDKDWTQEGAYISFNDKLDDPSKWKKPIKLLDRKEIFAVPGMYNGGMYPQVIGLNTRARETDKRAGKVARLFVQGKSIWEITFERAGV